MADEQNMPAGDDMNTGAQENQGGTDSQEGMKEEGEGEQNA